MGLGGRVERGHRILSLVFEHLGTQQILITDAVADTESETAEESVVMKVRYYAFGRLLTLLYV